MSEIAKIFPQTLIKESVLFQEDLSINNDT